MKRTLWPGLLLVLLIALPVAAQDAAPIEVGETVSGQLTPRGPVDEYTFEGQAGQMLTITLVSDDFDPYLVLRGPSGDQVATDDDSAGSLDSRIGPYTLDASGAYTIAVESYTHYFNSTAPLPNGAYTLTLEESNVRRIEYTQSVKGTLGTAGASDYYSFQGQAGDLINVTVDAVGGPVSVVLYQDGAALLSNSTDFVRAGEPLISHFALPQRGDYLLSVSTSTGDVEYTLEVNRTEVTPLVVDVPVEMAFDESVSVFYFSFEGQAGDVYDLIVTGDGNIDTTLTLTGPDGSHVSYSDDDLNLDPAIRDAVLPQDGVYTVMAQPFSPPATGAVTLVLQEGLILSLDEGPLLFDLISGQFSDTISFSGTAGEQVRLVLEVTRGVSISPYLTVTQSGMSLAYANGSSVTRLAVDFVVPGNGMVFISLEDYSYQDGQMRLSLERGIPSTILPVETATVEPTVEPTPEVTATAEPVVTDEPAPDATAEATDIAATPDVTDVPPEPTPDATEAPGDGGGEATPEATEAA